MLVWLLPVVFALDPFKVKYAVNCGGEEVTTYDDVTYLSDRGYSTGIVSDFGKSSQIKLTKTQELYQTERYAESDFSYTLPLEEQGNYVLILKFSEVWFSGEQEKLFNVKIGDITVVNLLDIFAQVGKFAAYDEFIQFKFENGKVLINNLEAKGAYKNGKLKVDFMKTDFDNPKINAIVLFKGKIEETDYLSQKKFIESIKRRDEEKLIREAREFRKDPVFEDLEDFEDLSLQPEVIAIEENQSLFAVLSTVPALVIISLLLVLGVAACLPSKSNSQVKPKRT